MTKISDRTQRAALDMAAALGMDAAYAAETLGRALDSPVEGIAALTRQGFLFKVGMKEWIRALTEQGRVAEAQALILTEVESAYKGAAGARNAA